MKPKTLFNGATPTSQSNVGEFIASTNNASFQYDFVGTLLTLKPFISLNGIDYEEITDTVVSLTADGKGIVNLQDMTINTKVKLEAVGDGTLRIDSLF